MHEERRRAYRFPVLHQQQWASLRVGDTELQVRLVDQSATGFSLLAEDHPGCFAGEMVWLKTDAGWTSVRVVKVRHNEEGTRIGVERLADLPEAPQRDRSSNMVLGDSLKQAPPRSSVSMFLGWALAFTVVVGMVMWASTLKFVRFGSFAVIGSTAPSDADHSALQAVHELAATKQVQLQQAVREFSGTMLSLPDVAQKLQLTPEQQRQLREILATSHHAEEALRSTLRGDKAKLLAEASLLREKASQQAEALLTPEQQLRWRSMVDAAFQSVKPPTEPAPRANGL